MSEADSGDQHSSETPEVTAKLSETVNSFIDSIIEDFRGLPEVHDSVLESIVEKRVSMLHSLSMIDDTTFSRISPIVAENTKYLFSGEWALSWSWALRTKPRLQNLGTLTLVVVVWGSVIAAFAGHHIQLANVETVCISAVAVVAFSICLWLIGKTIRFLTSTRWAGAIRLLMTVGLVWLTVSLGSDKHKIFRFFMRVEIYCPASLKKYYAIIHWPSVIHNALWVLSCVMVFRILWMFFMFVVKRLMLMRAPRSSNAVMQSATILEKLLQIAYLLDRSLLHKRSGKIASVPYKVRAEVVDLIAQVARTIEGPWVRSLRTGYRSTDQWIAQQGLNIAHGVLDWQARAVFGGHHLEAVRDACTQALIDAADGDWQKLATGDNIQRKSRLVRYREAGRKILAMAIPVPLAIVTNKFIPTAYSGYRPAILLAGILLTAVQLLAVLDPEVITRLNTVISATNTLRRPPKS